MKRLLTIICLLLGATASADTLEFVRPPYLRIGDTVGLVTPAAKLAAKTDTALLRGRFASWGLHVKFAPHCCDQSDGYFAAPDSVRAADLQAMIEDPTVKAVIACRGGYGSGRLLPMLRLQELRWNPKWLVGFSDLTTLHAALAHVGVESIHGTMPGSFVFEEEDLAAESLRRALFGLLRRIDVAPHPLDVAGKARGRLTGGNLTVLCAACGTPEALQTDSPTILFLEEVNEYVYRVDRMMQQLLRSGALSNVQAVVVGDFSHIAGAERFGADAYERVAAHLRPLGIPLLFGFPAGHDILNEALYMGRRAELTVDAEGGHLVFEGEAAEE